MLFLGEVKMWKQATTQQQKLAIINGLLPLTANDYLSALIHLSGDEDENIVRASMDRLRTFQSNKIRAMITPEVRLSSARSLAKFASERRDSAIVISLLEAGRLEIDWLLTLFVTNDQAFWTPLVSHRELVKFSLPRKDDFLRLFSAINLVLADLYTEQISYLREDEKVVQPQEEEAQGRVEEVAEGEEEDEDVVELDDTIFDFPDFLTSDTAFEGLSAEDMMEQRKTVAEMIREMNMGEKVKIAMLGNMEVRKILMKDPRKQIVMAVLSNPRISDKEVAAMAGDPASSLEVISHISGSKTLSKNYQVKLALINNPKTPIKTALALLDFIRINDLKNLAKSRNVPNVIKVAAAKRAK